MAHTHRPFIPVLAAVFLLGALFVAGTISLSVVHDTLLGLFFALPVVALGAFAQPWTHPNL